MKILGQGEGDSESRNARYADAAVDAMAELDADNPEDDTRVMVFVLDTADNRASFILGNYDTPEEAILDLAKMTRVVVEGADRFEGHGS